LNIEDGSFQKFDHWIVDAIIDAQQEGQDITIEEIELSQPPHISATYFSGMWAYGSHLRVEEKDTGKENCDCIVNVEFHHDTEKKIYVGFIQKIIQVDYGETNPILLKCKWIKPSTIQRDQYGFVRANARQVLSKTDEPYVSPLQVTQSFLIDDVTSPGWSYVIQVESRSKRKFMEYVDIMVDEQCTSLQETLEEEVEDDNRVVFEEEIFIPNEEAEIENVMHDQENDLYKGDGENEADAYTSDHDCDLDGNANHDDDDFSP
jgi:hypothetical protein